MNIYKQIVAVGLAAFATGACTTNTIRSNTAETRPDGGSAVAMQGSHAEPMVVIPIDADPSKPQPTAPAARQPASLESTDPTELSAEVIALLPDTQRISLSVPDATIPEISRMMARSADINIIVDDTLTARGSIELKNVTTRDAFAALARRYELRLERQGGVLLVTDARKPRFITKMIHAGISDFSTLEEKLKGILGDQGRISISPAARTVFIEAPADRVAQVERLLSNIEIEERQVAIEARIFEVSFDDRLDFGVRHEHLYDAGASTVQVLQNLLPNNDQFGVVAANSPGTLESTIRALRTLGTLELLSAPRVSTLNTKQASIEVIQEVPFIQTTNSVSQQQAGGSVSTFQEVQFKDAGITLKVTPTIMADGSVRLDAQTAVSQVTGFFQGIPIIDRRNLQSIVYLADGGTFFLGGLMQRSVTDIEIKVPILGDIPLLGLLFKRIEQQVKRKELIVLLTTRVIQGTASDQITNEFRLRYRDEKETVEQKRGGTRVSGGDVPAVR